MDGDYHLLDSLYQQIMGYELPAHLSDGKSADYMDDDDLMDIDQDNDDGGETVRSDVDTPRCPIFTPTIPTASGSREEDASVGAASPSPSSVQDNLDLTRHPLEARQAIYQDHFEDHLVRYEDLCAPPICASHPNLGPEIFAAYLHHTTFTLRTWVNYDHVAARFYSHHRMVDAGTPRFTRSQGTLQRIVKTNVAYRDIRKLRLMIGSAWRDFLTIDLEVVPQEDGGNVVQVVRHYRDEQQAPRIYFSRAFARFVDKIVETLDGHRLPRGQRGMQLRELLGFAMLCRYKPNADGMYEEELSRYGKRVRAAYRGDWMDGGEWALRYFA